MTDAFRDKIIYLPIFNDKKHIFELQRTFIYLLGTQRPVFAPTRLAKVKEIFIFFSNFIIL